MASAIIDLPHSEVPAFPSAEEEKAALLEDNDDSSPAWSSLQNRNPSIKLCSKYILVGISTVFALIYLHTKIENLCPGFDGISILFDHLFCWGIAFWLGKTKRYPPKKLDVIGWWQLTGISAVFAAVSPLYRFALQDSSVGILNVIHDQIPIVVLVFSALMLGARYSYRILFAVLLVVAGITYAQYDSASFTKANIPGLIIPPFPVLLQSFVQVLVFDLLAGALSLPPTQIISYISPFSLFFHAIYLYANDLFHFNCSEISTQIVLLVLLRAAITFISLQVMLKLNAEGGPLTVAVAFNVIAAVLFLFSSMLFGTGSMWGNDTFTKEGAVVTLIGALLYLKFLRSRDLPQK
ncbi:uncharacterized protein VTP21DRAFT_801 [Calcarisporiella thermophila]|uniref:uncharacterized protein n=1 Tax=Calcarisporiella thermophila TaxID=911321 RepID=UPI003743B182